MEWYELERYWDITMSVAKSLDLKTVVASAPFEGGIIPLPELMLFWPSINKELDTVPHIWNTHWTKEALYSGAMMGRFQVWGFGPAGQISVVVFTEIVNYPANKILYAFLAFGNSLERVLPCIEAVLERFAQESECSICEVTGRPGWERKIPRLKRVGVVLRSVIERKRIH